MLKKILNLRSIPFVPLSPITKLAGAAGVLLVVLSLAAFIRLSRFVDAKLHDGTLDSSTTFYSSARMLEVGDEASPVAVAHELGLAGYTESADNPMGSFRIEGPNISVNPGRSSYFRNEPAEIHFIDGRVSEIFAPTRNESVVRYSLEPQPLAAIAEGTLGRSRSVQFGDIPQSLVNALLSAEDKHFFHHAGFDPLRILKAAVVNLRSGRREQGGSTLTMQLARNMYLDSDKNWKRKIAELFVAEMLEWKLSKKQILENYANHVYLGRGSGMDVRGFAQASETFFGKALKDISVAEAAMLAGLAQRPSYFDPIRHTDRAIARRNVVLRLMRQNGLLAESQFREASAEQIQLASRAAATSGAPWFLDLAIDQLETAHGGETQAHVYTTLDSDLQRMAMSAVAEGMGTVDAQLRSRNLDERPQVALVALDSHTGEVKAVVGGRNFGMSQLNHATTMRQPGSVFKPFVYAAALNTNNDQRRLTAASTVQDSPTTFHFAGQNYSPSNHGDHFYGTVTLRRALAKSMNIAAVSVAEEVGYEKVFQTSRSAGLNDRMRATPALALGAYEATPLEMAASYTVFANEGRYVAPSLIREVRSLKGDLKYQNKRISHRVLTQEAAFVMQDMLQEVLRTGTAAGARTKLRGPAAGKTGTSRDGWFVGYSSNLICAVWVGYDSNRDLDLEGARSALPVWTAFMRAAGARTRYRGNFASAPNGVNAVLLDSATGLPAGPNCTMTHREYFIAGTEPIRTCTHDIIPKPLEEVPAPQDGMSLVTVSYEKVQ